MKVYIRAPEKGDCTEFIANTKKSHAMHRPWVFPVSTEHGFAKYLEAFKLESHCGFLVFRIKDNAMVGVVNLNEITTGCMQTAFVGYWAVAGYEGNGYLTQGVALAIDYAFDSLALNRVEACVQPANTKSIALVRRLSMEYEGISRKYLKVGGEWKDHQRWSVLRVDWHARGGSLMLAGIDL